MRTRVRHFAPSLPHAVLLVLCMLFAVSSCGKKGALTLTSREKPPAPSHLAAQHREGAIMLTWDFPAAREQEVESFIVLRATEGQFEKIGFAGSVSRSFGDRDVKDGTAYRYEVLTRNFAGINSAASNISAITPYPGPVAPTGITSQIVDDSVVLSWESSGAASSYNVYRTFTKGVYDPMPLNAAPIATTNFYDTFFVERPVYYTIRALSANLDEGPPSAEIAVDPRLLVPTAPEGLRCFASTDKIYLYWNEARAVWVTGFRIYRKTPSGAYALIGETQIPSFVDMRPSVKGDYRVTALGPSREGPPAEQPGGCGQ